MDEKVSRIQALVRGRKVRKQRQLEEEEARKLNPHQSKQSPFVPSSKEAALAFCSFANITKDDVVLDIGCGNGIIIVTAAEETGCVALGIDYDANLCNKARQRAMDAKVDVTVHCMKLQEMPSTMLEQATVVFLFMLPQTNRELQSILLKSFTHPKARLVTWTFTMPDWPLVKSQRTNEHNVLHLYDMKQVHEHLTKE